MRRDQVIASPEVERELRRADEALPRPSRAEEDALRARLSSTQAPRDTESWPPLLSEPRARMDSRYPEPATSHRPLIGPALVLTKRAFRFAFQPLINEVLRKQVEFNESIVRSLALIHEQLQAKAREDALWREELEARLRPEPKPRSRKA